MTVKEIVKKYLEDNGYDGLCTFDCGCPIDDLIPCGDCFESCVPGHKKITHAGPIIVAAKEKEVKGLI